MTISKESFGSSALEVFIKSNLNVRDSDDVEGFVWHASRGDGADVDSIVYELDPGDLSVVRSVALGFGVQVEGCGGKENVLYVSVWNDGGSANIGEYPIDETSWGSPPLTADRSTSFFNPDGMGGDTEIAWVCTINSVGGDPLYKLDATDFSVIAQTGAVYSRCDAIGGSSTVCWCAQYEGGYPGEDHWMQLDVDDLENELQDVPVMWPGGADLYVTEGIGGSEERVWANKLHADDLERWAQVFQVDPSDLHVLKTAFAPENDARGTGGN